MTTTPRSYHWAVGNTEGGSFSSVSATLLHARRYILHHTDGGHSSINQYWGKEITLEVKEGSAAGMGKTIFSWTGNPMNLRADDWINRAGLP